MKIIVDTVTDSKKDIELAANFLIQLASQNSSKQESQITQFEKNEPFDMSSGAGMGFFDNLDEASKLSTQDNDVNKSEDEEIMTKVQFY
jgi:hypothetical protein